MSRDSRNSVLFDADTIRSKPRWLQLQIAAICDTGAAVRPEVAPTHTKVAPSKQKPSNGTPAPDNRIPGAESEPPLLDGSLRTPPREAAYSGRVRISVTSVRKRLIDPDNLCPKYFIDCCRYAGLVRDDTPEQVEIVTTQRRVSPGEAEHTEILIEPIP